MSTKQCGFLVSCVSTLTLTSRSCGGAAMLHRQPSVPKEDLKMIIAFLIGVLFWYE